MSDGSSVSDGSSPVPSSPVSVEVDGDVVVVALDDGKANALGFDALAQVSAGFDQAAEQDLPVALIGSKKLFTGGFDLKVMRAGGPQVMELVMEGFELADKMLAMRQPCVIGCTGHAVAMGALLLCAADYRVGSDHDYVVQTNETEIGMAMPHSGLALAGSRLTPSGLNRAVVQAERLSPEAAREAGFLDQLVDRGEVVEVTLAAARRLGALDHQAMAETKSRYRSDLRQQLSDAMELDRRLG